MYQNFGDQSTGRDIFRSTMTLKRFQFLTQMIRFDEKERRNREDKFSPIRQLFEQFKRNCKKNYELSEFTTIDEMLRAFHGRCPFRMYMPNKPAKYGLKIYIICDAKTSYMWDANVFR